MLRIRIVWQEILTLKVVKAATQSFHTMERKSAQKNLIIFFVSLLCAEIYIAISFTFFCHNNIYQKCSTARSLFFIHHIIYNPDFDPKFDTFFIKFYFFQSNLNDNSLMPLKIHICIYNSDRTKHKLHNLVASNWWCKFLVNKTILNVLSSPRGLFTN